MTGDLTLENYDEIRQILIKKQKPPNPDPDNQSVDSSEVSEDDMSMSYQVLPPNQPDLTVEDRIAAEPDQDLKELLD